MNIEVTSPKSYSREIEITYTADEVSERFETFVNEVAARAELPGFRKGKVPKAIIIKNYGDAIKNDLEEELIKEGLSRAIKEHEIQPLISPRIEEETDFDPGRDYSVTLKVEVKPEVELKEYKGLELRKIVEPVDESEIDETIEELRNRSGMLKPIEDRPAEEGDIVLVNFRPLDDEEPTKRVFKLDKSATTTIIGKEVGDKFEGHFEFPEEHPERELAGNIFDAEVEILELKELIPADIDEEFLKQFGEDIKSEQDLREKIREELQDTKERKAERQMREMARDQLIRKNPIEHSPMVIEAAVRDTMRRYWNISQLDEEQYREIQKEVEPGVTKDFSITYIMQEIADREGIEVTRDEVKQRIAELARANNIEPEAYYRYLRKEGNLDSIEADVRATKAMDIVIENAKIIEEQGR